MIARARRYFEGIRDRDVMLILIGFFLGAVGVSVSAHFLSREVNLWVWLDSFTQNFGTEMFGGFLTFLLIEVVRGSRREQEAAEQEAEELKRELIRKMGSDVRDVAVPAVGDLHAHGWLTDGSLEGTDLGRANLQKALLVGANLQGTYLFKANLQGASLWRANLQKANLPMANLQGAILEEANLQWANLSLADLQGAYLFAANLQGAHLGNSNLQGAHLWQTNLQETDLQGANLQGAHLRDAVFDEDTTLPDGTQWTSEADLARFTDPAHPDFWRSDDPESPAREGAQAGDSE